MLLLLLSLEVAKTEGLIMVVIFPEGETGGLVVVILSLGQREARTMLVVGVEVVKDDELE